MGRKFIIAILLLMTSAWVLAQNTATVSQTGTANAGTVTQENSGNTAAITQGSASRLLRNSTAIIDQKTNGNTATVNQGIKINANNVNGQIYQSGGDNNQATVEQDRYTRGYGDKWGVPDGNVSRVDQIGASNEADLVSEARRGVADIYQEGTANYGKLLQDGERDFEAHIVQIGGQNSGDIDQFGDANHQAVIYQMGEQNFAKTRQTSSNNNAAIRTYGDFNGNAVAPIEIYQHGGRGNTATVEQGTLLGSVGGNAAYVEQNGGSNQANISQMSSNNTAYLLQNGDANATTLTQKNGIGNVTQMTQSGSGTASIVQDGGSNIVKGLNTDVNPAMATFSGGSLTIGQTGTGNTVHLNANGTVAVTQAGSSNIATVSQK